MVRARTSEWLSAGWRMVVNGPHFGMFVLLALIHTVIMSIAGATLIGLIISGPVTAGVYAVILALMRTGKFDLNNIGEGFKPFVQTMLVGLVSGLFILVGFFLCIIPGFFVTALYLFSLFLAVDRKMEFWDAMEESRKKVQEDLGGFVVFVLAIFGINLLGTLLCGVGVFITGPITWCAITVAYRELWPEQPATVVTTSPIEPPSDITPPIEPPPSEESGA